jgi:hypothetical protein
VQKYYAPQYREKQFNCPYTECGVFAHMDWFNVAGTISNRYTPPELDFELSRCGHCGKISLWHGDGQFGTDFRLIHPLTSIAPSAHPDLPEICIDDFNEAREIVSRSPRGSGALLRLCLEKLCAHLTGDGNKSINDNIAALVKEGLPQRIQQSLDALRVLGNSAVHPKEIDLNETPDTVRAMFHLINVIVENRITEPKAVEDIYNMLPEGAREAIQRRDTK